jgi:putative thioredoxin
MTPSTWVENVDQRGFQERVIERSRSLPVVVDFWAPWCGPCRALGPLLERLTEAAGGAWVLAKVNVDENPALAGEFQVSGIPAVFAIRNGEVVDQFTGLLPEPQLKAWLQRLIPTAADRLTQTAEALEASDPAAAEAKYREALAADAGHEAARVGLARLLLTKHADPAEIRTLLQGLDYGRMASEAQRLRRVLRLRELPHSDADLANAQARITTQPDNAESWYQLGAILAARGQYAEALDALLAAAERDQQRAGKDIRELMVEIFHIVGVRSPLADEYRDRLQKLLY